MKRALAILAAAFALASSVQAQAVLTASSSTPAIDGTLGAGKYQFTTTVSGMTIGATLGSDGNVYLAIQAQTAGWVALGVGGRRMNGSRLFLGCDTGSQKVFKEQKGAGHSHGDVDDPVVTKWAVAKVDGKMTLELTLPEKAAVTAGKIDLLFAYSDSSSLTAYHRARGSLSISVP